MRVIAGSLKGRRLQTPTWEGLRPTSDSLRETLFNVLGARVAGARVLDGYAGTGAIGIPSGCVIIRSGFDTEASVPPGPFEPFDIVVLDPPYEDPPEQVLVAAAPLVAPGGVLVLEHARRRAAPDAAGSLARTRQIVAGDSALSLYAHPPTS
jgi:16S rRNA (guanine966-N2)-methyltransferase